MVTIDYPILWAWADAYSKIQAVTSRPARIDATRSGGAAKWWASALSVLFLGAMAGAKYLISHGLQRESDPLLRQAFEFSVTLRYFMRHEDIARREINAFPLHAQLAFAKTGFATEADYLASFADEARKEFPDLEKYKTRDIASTAAMLSEDPVMKLVELDFYKLPSQLAHGTILSIVEIAKMTPAGLIFDPHADQGSENQRMLYLALCSQRYMIDVARALGRTAPGITIARSLLMERARELKLYVPCDIDAFLV